MLHWGAAAAGAARALARLGVAIDAVEANRLYHPLARERIARAGAADRIRLLEPDGCRGDYDLLVLVGDPALRSEPPSPKEVAAAIARIRPGGKILLIGWPVDRPVPPGSPLPLPHSVLRRIALQRLLRPRGAAPAGGAFRRGMGVAAAPVALGAPAPLLRLFRERTGILLRAGS
ncbi:MAG: hypothetical protein GF346_01230 [Candidatus Eisenbacteria bacterium]|nr:hypothetical protein [Candidatus Latescibacterota bacterium]MBD3301052.1 hypothetical protein [Candidatus Eisenbacteria bacterium]